MKKQSIHSSDRSSSFRESELKSGTRTLTETDSTPSDDDDDYHVQQNWPNSNSARYSGDFVDPLFPVRVSLYLLSNKQLDCQLEY